VRQSDPPLVCIRQVHVNGKELKDNKVTAFPHGKGNLEFQYKALSYIAPQKVQFRCQLEGYDHDWIESGNKKSASYMNLSRGIQIPCHRRQRRWRLEYRRRFLRNRIAPEFLSNDLVLPGMRRAGDGRTLGGYAWRVGHLRKRQREMQAAHELLEARVEERTIELEAQKQHLEREIEERKKLEEQFFAGAKNGGHRAAGRRHRP